MPEGDLPREAAEEIPRGAQQRPEEHGDGEVEEEGVRGQERGYQDQHQDSGAGGPPRHDLPTPKSPDGRKSKTSRNMVKPIVSL